MTAPVLVFDSEAVKMAPLCDGDADMIAAVEVYNAAHRGVPGLARSNMC